MGVLIMSLSFPDLPEIDEQRTIENVRNYFDVEFPKMVDRCSFSSALIKSPSFDITGVKSSSKGNSQENKVFNHLNNEMNEYDKFVESTAYTINRLSEPYKSILVDVYLGNKTNKQAQGTLHISRTRYTELKNTAFVKFAIKFQSFYDLTAENQKANTLRTECG